MAEVHEILVQLKALNVEQLTEACGRLSIQISAAKKDNEKAIRNLLDRYLLSEEVEDSTDGGLEIFNKLKDEISALKLPGLEDYKDDKSKISTI